MKVIAISGSMASDQNEEIRKTVEKEQARLFNFIRKRVIDEEEAQDILQDVFYQFTESYRLMKPIEQISSWLFTVARNKITDLFRKKKAVAISRQFNFKDDDELNIEDLLPDLTGGPEADFARSMVMEAVQDALAELPKEQRDVFVMHEFENKSFKEIAESKRTTINTQLSRKRYAILHLRERLQDIYTEFVLND